MKAILMTAPGGLDVLKLATIAEPVSHGPNQLLVRVRAAGINPLDTKIRKQHFFYPDNLPAILGVEGAGVVEQTGPSVTRFHPGDEIYFFSNGLGLEPGAYAEYTVIHEEHAACKPKTLSMAEAAAIPVALITAWEALVDRVALKSGEKVLIHAGAGGVGHIAVQLARVRGAQVAATVSGKEKAELVKSLGAELSIDYREQDFVEEALRWTGGRGVDVVLDTVGGATFCKSFKALRMYGRVATLLSTPCELADINVARLRNISVGFVQMTAPSYLNDAEARRAQTRILENGASLFEQGKLKVLLSAVLQLEDASTAHRLVEEGHTSGKVVLQID
ncbi:MAG TPA: zinc-dependent alcohol dehydrogenase family protein [Burkholderiaceae bacterium]|nr:zinc-dependent alcohol dehydrogenase family protein [Burkholderiaceae bacterium]